MPLASATKSGLTPRAVAVRENRHESMLTTHVYKPQRGLASYSHRFDRKPRTSFSTNSILVAVPYPRCLSNATMIVEKASEGEQGGRRWLDFIFKRLCTIKKHLSNKVLYAFSFYLRPKKEYINRGTANSLEGRVQRLLITIRTIVTISLRLWAVLERFIKFLRPSIAISR